MKKFISHLQGVTCFSIASFIFWFSGPIVQHFDPTAGVWDRGSMHGLAIGACAYFLAVWLAWLAFQIEWPSLDKHIDENRWLQDMRAMSPASRVWFTLAVWSVLFTGALLCLLSWR